MKQGYKVPFLLLNFFFFFLTKRFEKRYSIGDCWNSKGEISVASDQRSVDEKELLSPVDTTVYPLMCVYTGNVYMLGIVCSN